MKSKSQTDQILSRIGDSRLADFGEAGTFAAYVAADVEKVLQEYFASWPKPSTMAETFEIKAPAGAMVFLSPQEYEGYKKYEYKQLKASRIIGEPTSYPCIGFEVLSVPNTPFGDIECLPQKIMAFLYLHSTQTQKDQLLAKSQYEAIDRFEAALLTSE